MSVFLLIRHAGNPAIGKRLTGTLPGVHLNEEGKAQAEMLAERLSRISIDAIYCSPLERAFETALPLAGRFGLKINTSAKLSEVDFGDWSGLGVPSVGRRSPVAPLRNLSQPEQGRQTGNS